ncbi:MAG TPA: DUF971 domain-containing protein [Pyrinomonadaceae bacterium]|nr:DUF971 domain-containing protein [Pyrinomonadaceae bacterium]
MIEASERRGPAVEPREIKQVGEGGLIITWADGVASEYNAAELRRVCPCAQCVNEWNGQRVLKPESISDELEITAISVVGRYALNFRWSDGHETGIYSFRYLREFADGQPPASVDVHPTGTER